MKYIKSFKLFESNNFNNTKVVDDNGNKILMFHGGSYCGTGELKGDIWFTSEKEDAKYYAESNFGCLVSAYLNIQNPLYSGQIEHLNIELSKDIFESAKKRDLLNAIKTNSDNIIEYLETNGAVLIANDLGKDGVIDIHDGDILDCVVFNNSQIEIENIIDIEE